MDLAKKALHYAKAAEAAAEMRADCLRIIIRAEMRMADEIDRGEPSGIVARPGGNRQSIVPTADNASECLTGISASGGSRCASGGRFGMPAGRRSKAEHRQNPASSNMSAAHAWRGRCALPAAASNSSTPRAHLAQHRSRGRRSSTSGLTRRSFAPSSTSLASSCRRHGLTRGSGNEWRHGRRGADSNRSASGPSRGASATGTDRRRSTAGRRGRC